MNALVVYDSRFGNTERVARAIGWGLAALGPIEVRSVADAEVGPGIGLLVIGAPTHAHGISRGARDFLDGVPGEALRDLPAATFDTRYKKPRFLTGSAGIGLAHRLAGHGARLLAPAESFFVAGSEGPLLDGELDRATEWGREIAAALAPARPAASPPPIRLDPQAGWPAAGRPGR
jgi:flavodoxin